MPRLVTRTLEANKLYIVSIDGSKVNGRIGRFEKVTEKGYNFIALKTGRKMFKSNFYPDKKFKDELRFTMIYSIVINEISEDEIEAFEAKNDEIKNMKLIQNFEKSVSDLSDDDKLLLENGWVVECQSPFEIRNYTSNSFASGEAAYTILYLLKNKNETVYDCISEIPQQKDSDLCEVEQIHALYMAALRLGLKDIGKKYLLSNL